MPKCPYLYHVFDPVSNICEGCGIVNFITIDDRKRWVREAMEVYLRRNVTPVEVDQCYAAVNMSFDDYMYKTYGFANVG